MLNRKFRMRRWFAVFFLGLCAGMIMDCPAAPLAGTQGAAEKKTIVAAGKEKKNEEVNADEMQRAEARKYRIDLLFFLAVVITLAVVLGMRARDLEKLREEGFFQDRGGPGKEDL